PVCTFVDTESRDFSRRPSFSISFSRQHDTVLKVNGNAVSRRPWLEPPSFTDLAGKLHRLRIECTRCARKGRHSVANLIAQHGHNGNMSKWVSDLRGGPWTTSV